MITRPRRQPEPVAPPSVQQEPAPVQREPAPLLRGAFEPPSGLVQRALRHNWMLVCVIAALAAGGGLAAGLGRHSTYTAAATLQVGQVNPNSPGFYSYVSSAAALASAFSRGVSAEPVLAEVDRRLGIAPAAADSRLSAAPIPLSPAFRVFATGDSAGAAMRLANVAAGALVSYEANANDSNPEASSLLGEYHRASLALHHAAAKLTAIEESTRGKHTGSALASLLAPARAERDTAAARVAAVGDAYTAAITSQAPRHGLVSLLAGATSASSDHHAKAELIGFIALLAGLLGGSLIAVARELRSQRRRDLHSA
jgi:capsular polysaccharide biosynthesis protein